MQIRYKYLDLASLQAIFLLTIMMSFLYDNRLVDFLSVTLGFGTLLQPISFMVNSVINEKYGYKISLRAILIGLVAVIVFIFYTKLVLSLPTPSFAQKKANDLALVSSWSYPLLTFNCIAYIVSHLLNTMLWHKFKKITELSLTKKMIIISSIASLIDICIYIPFLHISYSIHSLLLVVFISWILSLFVILLLANILSIIINIIKD